jgi:hypothetical protein
MFHLILMQMELSHILSYFFAIQKSSVTAMHPRTMLGVSSERSPLKTRKVKVGMTDRCINHSSKRYLALKTAHRVLERRSV